MACILFICPTHRDLREIARLDCWREHRLLQHDYASLALEDMTAEEVLPTEPPGAILDELDTLLQRCANDAVDAVVSTDDYPGSALAAIISSRLRQLGTCPAANLICQHKFSSRQVQRECVPEATPAFAAIDVAAAAEKIHPLSFPHFVKPVKSFFSVGAHAVRSPEELDRAREHWRDCAGFFTPFGDLLHRVTGKMIGTEYLLGEALLTGVQTTLEGFVYRGEVEALGVVDSVMFPGTVAFERFEYPSQLPQNVQDRMAAIGRTIMSRLNYQHGQFNIEFMHDPATGDVHIIEINPRMSSQFADLFEKVDGTNSYSVLLDLALGRKPTVHRRQGPHAFAASCVMRTFENQFVEQVPTGAHIDSVLERFPDARVEILATPGVKLSQQMQDSCSYRYGMVNLGGTSRREVLNAYAHCCTLLPFDFQPVASSELVS